MSGDKKPKICPASDVQDTGDGEIGTPSASAGIPQLAGGPELHSSTDFKLGPMAQPPYQGHQKILHKVTSDTVSVSGEPKQLDGTCTLAKNDIFQDDPVDREQQMSTEWTLAPMPQQQFHPYLHPQMTGTFPMTDQGNQYPDGFSTGQECSPYQKYQLQSETSSLQAPNPMMPHGQGKFNMERQRHMRIDIMMFPNYLRIDNVNLLYDLIRVIQIKPNYTIC